MGRRAPSLLTAIGPGIVFAGAAIGVSHLVQATRAGAGFGLTLLLLVVAVHLLKYPALSFAPRYVAATGDHLLHAYRRQGMWAIAAFALVQALTMFTIVAAVTMVTAQVLLVAASSFTGDRYDVSLAGASAVVLAGCAAILASGGYRLMERFIKVLMAFMALATVSSAAAVLPGVVREVASRGLVTELTPDLSNAALLAFAVPLAGWMPAPLDIAVWNSLWCREQSRHRGRDCTRREAKLDFNVGYALCLLTAVCFLIMGAGLIYYPGVEAASGNAPLVEQLLSLYTGALGEWIKPLVAIGAAAVMVSTTITVIDALPRTAVAILGTLRRHEAADPPAGSSESANENSRARTLGYWVWFVVLAGGGLLIIQALRSSLGTMVDFATTLSFCGTPVLAYLNHRAMFSRDVPESHRPGFVMRSLSIGAIVIFALAAIAYIPWYFGVKS